MYQIPKPRKNAKKVVDSLIAKRKKVVLNFAQREEIFEKKSRGYSVKNRVLTVYNFLLVLRSNWMRLGLIFRKLFL
jgi:hypothetical protein